MTNTYTDIDFNFTKTDTGDVYVLTDEECVKQSVRNIILTGLKELTRYQREDFGSNSYHYLGEKINRISSIAIEDELRNAILNHEERVDVISISVDTDNNSYIVEIMYLIKSINLNDSLVITLSVLT